jgi:hypothetical protein
MAARLLDEIAWDDGAVRPCVGRWTKRQGIATEEGDWTAWILLSRCEWMRTEAVALFGRIADTATPTAASRLVRKLNPALGASEPLAPSCLSYFSTTCWRHDLGFHSGDGRPRSACSLVPPVNLRRRSSSKAMSVSLDEAADSSTDFRAISLSRSLTYKCVSSGYIQPQKK